MEKKPSIAITTMIFSILLLIIFYGIFVLKAEPHMPLIASVILLGVIGKLIGFKWSTLEKGLLEGISVGIKPIIILALVGMVIAAWMKSGTVPTLLDYGFQFISPKWFLISSLFITIIVSSFTGSSFTTIGTIGVALIGVALGLGVNPAIAAGAIISGACFGDKMSPLSDTTNFAPGVVSVDIFTHIKHMLWTTIPSLTITAVIFFFLGEGYSSNFQSINEARMILAETFNLSIWTLISPLVVMILAYKRFPTIPILIAGIVTAVITGSLLQTNISVTQWFVTLQHGFSVSTGNEIVDGILNRGGLQSMTWSMSLVMIALGLGGMIKSMGLFDVLVEGVTRRIKRRGTLIATAASSSIGVNIITGEQYLSILLPGQAFKKSFEVFNLHPKNLSRTLEDAGTLVNPLIPWGVSGAFFASTLGVPVVEYLPFAFFLLLSPVITILLGYLGIGVSSIQESK